MKTFTAQSRYTGAGSKHYSEDIEYIKKYLSLKIKQIKKNC